VSDAQQKMLTNKQVVVGLIVGLVCVYFFEGTYKHLQKYGEFE